MMKMNKQSVAVLVSLVMLAAVVMPQAAQAQWARATGGSVTNEYVDANGIAGARISLPTPSKPRT
jgi:hypothetical protein